MEPTEPRDPITGVQIERPEPEIYLPGTPTASFVASVELIVRTLRS